MIGFAESLVLAASVFKNLAIDFVEIDYNGSKSFRFYISREADSITILRVHTNALYFHELKINGVFWH